MSSSFQGPSLVAPGSLVHFRHRSPQLASVPLLATSTFDDFVDGVVDRALDRLIAESTPMADVAPADGDYHAAMEVDSVPGGLDKYAYAFLMSLEQIFERCFGPLAHPSDVGRLVSLCGRAIDLLRSDYIHRCGLKRLSLWGVEVDPLPEVLVPLLIAVSHTAKLLRGISYRHHDLPRHDEGVLAYAAHWPHSVAQYACQIAKVKVVVGGRCGETVRSDAVAHALLRANTPRSVAVKIDNMVPVPDPVGPLIVFLTRPNAHYVASDLMWMATMSAEIADATYTPALKQRCLALSHFYTHVSRNWVALRAHV